ncbi:MAG: glycosyltransferase [Ferruginibacter sp.]|nr:glycosyltransferase [Ferruginibacter sp.]
MKAVVQIQYSTESGGRSALRLQRAFIKKGIQSTIISLQRDIHPVEGIVYLGKFSRYFANLYNRLQVWLTKNKDSKYALFSVLPFGINISKHDEIKKADIIYLHWVQNGFLNAHQIGKIASLNKPVIMVMHDMWSFSGGCHYSYDCNQYLSSCGNCPVFNSNRQKKFAVNEFKRKLKLYKKHNNIFFVSPSKWLYNCAKNSNLLKDKPVFYIPNIMERTVFKPVDKPEAKKILNIPTHITVIAFGAISIDSYRKGGQYLNKALKILETQIDSSNILILMFGSDYNKTLAETIPFKIRFLGYLEDEYTTALAYNASDVFVVPSLADNQPTTVQESLACGTPVVGFNVGGIPDMIDHKQNGYLATYKDENDLANGIKFCLDNNIKGSMKPFFEMDETINKHLQLFELAENIIKSPVHD